MMEAMTLGITLMAFDRMSRVISNACTQSGEQFNALQTRIRHVSDTMEEVGRTAMMVGAGITAGGLALGASLGLGDIIPQMLETEKKLIDIGNVGNLSKTQIAGLNSELSKISALTNQTTPELLEAVNFYTAQGIVDTKKLAEMTKVAGRVATAEGANITEVATAAYRVTDNLKVPVNQLNKVMDVLAQSGKEGSFELKNMAQYFPQLTASAMTLGMKGVPAVAQLGASLQIAMKGAGDASQAANNFANFIQKIRMPDTFNDLKKLEKGGFKGLSAQWERALKAKDPILEIIKLVTKLNQQGIKTTQIFQDKQVLDFVNIMIPNLQMYEKIKAKTLTANGVIGKDYDNVMNGTLAQIKSIQIFMKTMAKENLLEPLKKVNEILNKINSHPLLKKGLFNLMVGMLGGGLLLTAIGVATWAIGKMIGGYGRFLRISRELTPVLRANAMQLLRQGGLSGTAGFVNNPAINRSLAQANPYFRNQGYGSIGTNFVADIKRINEKMQRGIISGIKNTGRFITKIPANVIDGVKRLNAVTIGWNNTNRISIKNMGQLGLAMGGNLLKGIGSAIKAVWGFNMALLASPLFWIGIAIGGVVFLIYKYWKPITAFFKGVWQGIVEATKPLHPAFKKIGKALSPITNVVKGIFNWFAKLFTPINTAGKASNNFGLAVGKAIGGAIVWVAKMLKKWWDFEVAIVSLGKKIWDLSKPFREMLMWITKIALKFSPLGLLFQGGKWLFQMNDKNGKVTKHHTGLRLSPNEHWAVILKNEAVLNPAQAEMYRKYGLGKTVNLPSISHNFEAPRTKATLMKNIQANQNPIIHNNPTFNITGGGNSKDIENQIKNALRINQQELEKMLKKISYDQGRRSFA